MATTIAELLDELDRMAEAGEKPQRPNGPTLYVSEEAWQQLMEALESPPEPNEKLKALMRRKPIWER
jgi:hypothetical protein